MIYMYPFACEAKSFITQKTLHMIHVIFLTASPSRFEGCLRDQQIARRVMGRQSDGPDPFSFTAGTIVDVSIGDIAVLVAI